MLANPADTRTCRILIVDPDEDTRSLYRDVLTRASCTLAEAVEGRDALVMALSDPPALAITELRLPIVDGPTFCERLRRDVSTAHVPILALRHDPSTSPFEDVALARTRSVLAR